MSENFEQSPMEKSPEAIGLNSAYWAEKGVAREKFDVVFGNRKIEIDNFSDIALSDEQLRELQEVMREFLQIDNGSVFDKFRFIFIDDKQPIDPEHSEGINGMGVENSDGIIKLYPRALKPIPHRVENVSNFKGTLIHEFTHAFFADKRTIEEEWQKEFGWKKIPGKVEELQKLGLLEKLHNTPQMEWSKLHPKIWEMVREWTNSEPNRCITDYARMGPEEDIADSMIAAIANPGILDPDKLKFLREKILSAPNKKELLEIKIQKIHG